MSGEHVCFGCGNEAKASELKWIDTPVGDRLEHIAEDCPDMPAGFAMCRGCLGAYSSLAQVEWLQPVRFDDETGAWVEVSGGRYVPLGAEPPARHVRLTRAEYEAGLLDILPAGTLGLVQDGWPTPDRSEPSGWSWQDLALCRECLGRLGVKAEAAGQGSDEPSAEDGFAKIPADGEWRSIEDTARLAGFGLRNGKPLVRSWAREGLLEVTEQPTGAGGSNRKLYRRVVS